MDALTTLISLAVIIAVPAVLILALYIATGGLADDISTVRRARRVTDLRTGRVER